MDAWIRGEKTRKTSGRPFKISLYYIFKCLTSNLDAQTAEPIAPNSKSHKSNKSHKLNNTQKFLKYNTVLKILQVSQI